jgi:hypothetical protein
MNDKIRKAIILVIALILAALAFYACDWLLVDPDEAMPHYKVEGKV